uniref:CIDE-N domain-containing protein n=1 Tax=Sphenodon punctatus TaxID=8508 RepID=A0A8D0L2G1_SPHPU
MSLAYTHFWQPVVNAQLTPPCYPRCITASASMTQQLLSSPAPCARSYCVSNWDCSLRKGIMAESLRHLLEKVHSALLLVGTITLVLDEDGTSVETEEFFQSLQAGTVLLVLLKGQMWCPPLGKSQQGTSLYQLSLSCKPWHRIDVACVSFDLYKTNLQDVGCLNVKATHSGTYSMSYDLQSLHWTSVTMQATGHVLLGTSCYMQQLLDATKEEDDDYDDASTLRSIQSPPFRKMLQ